GERREDVLAKRIPAGVHYVGIGVGKRWSRNFMKIAAERTGGYFTQINPDEPITWRAFELAATLNTPRLLKVNVVDAAEKVTFLSHDSSIAHGEEVCAIARIGPQQALPKSVTLTGTLDGKTWHRDVPVANVAQNADYLPRTWAKLEIDRLLAADATKNKDQIIALSKAMLVTTPYTSLLVLENEAMYEQYKVDRGRKDHWAIYACPARIPVVHEPERGQTMVKVVPGGVTPAEQVLQSVVVRAAPAVLNWPAEENSASYLRWLQESQRDFREERMAHLLAQLDTIIREQKTLRAGVLTTLDSSAYPVTENGNLAVGIQVEPERMAGGFVQPKSRVNVFFTTHV